MMLGLADRSRVIDLFERLMSGDMPAALTLLKEQHDTGADPAQVLGELAEFTHLVTKLKLAPGAPRDAALTEDEQRRGMEFAEKLSIPVLTRTWQILLKGLQEVREAPRPLAAADMVLVRIAYAADLPSPAEAIRQLGSSPTESRPNPAPAPSAVPRGRGPGAAALAIASAPVPVATPQINAASKIRIESFDALVALAAQNRDIQIKTALERDVRLVRFEDGSLEFALAPGASSGLAQTLMRKLQDWTGVRWMVAISSAAGAPTLREQAEAKEQERRVGVQADPVVRSVLDRFPGAEIVAVRSNAAEDDIAPPVAVAAESGDEIAYADEIDAENDT
jgi:DNA polymerase-3 subunit gamma/tau